MMPQPAEIFAFLFLMIGPFKIIGPFAKMTEHASAKLTNQIATQATLFAVLGVLVASFLGDNILKNFGIPVPILALTGGLILFLVALTNVIQQYSPVQLQRSKASHLSRWHLILWLSHSS